MSDIVVKCRQCRRLIAKQPLSSFLTAHGQPVADIYGCSLTCVGKLEDVWYLDELTMSDWMRTAVEEGNFLKDKLKCPNCSTNLGAFDYVSGHKCPCKQQCVPFIHLVKSKIDIQYANRSPENTSEHAEQS
ncbi:E3 ubiquitin-protein ligase RNF180-like isoform X2 [Diaphorina citri]|uniref:E3 ubiquitin-protein ligase RNF180-like isoform X2 n=1 Tax=Diaphorina citri TaxID=121845 RepID=A0A1S3D179_DIACI|nr:E3 ubiquitin-protein ligase RNF180-like isoform X3 [Diaphorina citri]XP_026679511.1 E3 ubiquitin-protein ligase RNF180-like isoform X2 [Diaphorina citri]